MLQRPRGVTSELGPLRIRRLPVPVQGQDLDALLLTTPGSAPLLQSLKLRLSNHQWTMEMLLLAFSFFFEGEDPPPPAALKMFLLRRLTKCFSSSWHLVFPRTRCVPCCCCLLCSYMKHEQLETLLSPAVRVMFLPRRSNYVFLVLAPWFSSYLMCALLLRLALLFCVISEMLETLRSPAVQEVFLLRRSNVYLRVHRTAWYRPPHDRVR